MKSRFACLAALLVVAQACGSMPTAVSQDGLVIGGIRPCQGTPVQGGPHYAAGSVKVLKGTVTSKSSGPGEKVAVFPTTMVAVRKVQTNEAYTFSLAQGAYVLKADFSPPTTVTPFVEVDVKAGAVSRLDVPNLCF